MLALTASGAGAGAGTGAGAGAGASLSSGLTIKSSLMPYPLGLYLSIPIETIAGAGAGSGSYEGVTSRSSIELHPSDRNVSVLHLTENGGELGTGFPGMGCPGSGHAGLGTGAPVKTEKYETFAGVASGLCILGGKCTCSCPAQGLLRLSTGVAVLQQEPLWFADIGSLFAEVQSKAEEVFAGYLRAEE